MLSLSKIIENMELGHNVMHGQWDWMNDPEIHSTSWEWDVTGPSAHWKQTHNYIHHKYTNVLGMDDDVGYGLLRVTRDQRWKPFNTGNLLYNTLLALFFEYGIAAQHLELGKVAKGRVPSEETQRKLREVGEKVGKQILKDYVVHPAVTGPAWKSTLTANIAANMIRNVWTNAIIFCGHFPDGAEKFTKADIDKETPAQWYLRQMLGSANIEGGKLMDFMSGNLSYQIEHHLFPDLPSNRYSEIAVRVRELCDKYDLPYTTGPFLVQYAKSWRTIAKLSLPNKYLKATADDAPETASERKFGGNTTATIDPVTGRRQGLSTAIKRTRKRRGLRALLSR
jgi:linoleoyl-CoA desaturase